MTDKILATAKAWAALAGAILTALVGSLTPDDAGYKALTIVLAVVTAVAVYRVPNKENRTPIRSSRMVLPGQRGAGSIAELAFAAFVIVCALYVLVKLVG